MSESKHKIVIKDDNCPAPWRVEAFPREKVIHHRVYDAEGKVVMSTLSESLAHQIAAAPEMLEVLGIVQRALWQPLFDGYQQEAYLHEEEIEKLLAVLRKAKGQA